MKKEIIQIGDVLVEWSNWYSWQALEVPAKAQGGIRVPYKAQGVYMVRKKGSDKRLFIGWTYKSLGRMIQNSIIQGRADRPSLAGNRIKKRKDHAKLEIRWGITDRPLAVWEDLVKQHISDHGTYPKYCP